MSDDWRDDPRFSGKGKKNSKKTEARNQWNELGWMDQNDFGTFDNFYKSLNGNKSIKRLAPKVKLSNIKVTKKEKTTRDQSWRKDLGLDYVDGNEESKKPNVQHVIEDSDYQLNWGSTNPFENPIYWILTVTGSAFAWSVEGYELGGILGAVIYIFAGSLGMAIMFYIAACIIKFATESSEPGGLFDKWEKESKEAKKVEKEKKEKEREQSKNSASSAKSTNETSGSGGSGTAFFIDNKGHVITNNHVVKGFENRAKIFYDNEDVKLKFIACDEQLDLALLKANVQNEEYIEIADKVVRKMQNIVAAGYPLGKHLSDDLKFTSGIVSSLKGPGNNSAIMQIDAALNPGNSGGPIVDKENGHLAAVAVSGLRKDMTEGINYGIKASRVKEFLESNRITIKSKKDSSEKLDVSEKLENATVYISCE